MSRIHPDQSARVAIRSEAGTSGIRKIMPLPAQHQLPEREVMLLKKWINEGAEMPMNRQ